MHAFDERIRRDDELFAFGQAMVAASSVKPNAPGADGTAARTIARSVRIRSRAAQNWSSSSGGVSPNSGARFRCASLSSTALTKASFVARSQNACATSRYSSITTFAGTSSARSVHRRRPAKSARSVESMRCSFQSFDRRRGNRAVDLGLMHGHAAHDGAEKNSSSGSPGLIPAPA